MFNKYFTTKLIILVFILALSLPLAIKLVDQSQDSRSSASETSDTKINFKIALKGVKPESACLSSLNDVDLDIVNITKKVHQSQVGTSMIPITGETNQSGDQVFLVSGLVLDSNFKDIDASNYIQIKYKKYLSSRMCFDHQSSKITTSTVCNISLTNGVTYDFSNYSLIPGDINQDGIVNSSDFSIVKKNIDPSTTTACNQEGDINYDGMVNSFDLAYLKQSLLQTSDEVVLDSITITPTPTVEPTSTVEPTPTMGSTPTVVNTERSFTAEKYESTNYWFYLPKGYNKALKWPLVIFFHGDGGWGVNKLNKLLTAGDLAGHLKNGADYNAIAIEPQFDSPTENSQMILIKEKLIPYLIENYNVDPNRISLMGASSGAGRTIHMALKYPGFFSCLVTAALCEQSSKWGPLLVKENLWAFHGTADTVCADRWSEWTVNRIVKAGGNAKFTSLRNVGHSSSVVALSQYKVVDWMIRQILGKPVVE